MFYIVGHDMNINSSACRMIIMTSYVTTTVLLAAYSAALVSFMTVQDFKLPFSSFRELLQHRHYRLGALPGSAQITYFEVRHQHWHRVSARPVANLSLYCLNERCFPHFTYHPPSGFSHSTWSQASCTHLTASSHLLLCLENILFPIGPLRQNSVSISCLPHYTCIFSTPKLSVFQ
jgi:hypothetical protein